MLEAILKLFLHQITIEKMLEKTKMFVEIDGLFFSCVLLVLGRFGQPQSPMEFCHPLKQIIVKTWSAFCTAGAAVLQVANTVEAA